MPEAFTIGPILVSTRLTAFIAALLVALWLTSRLAARLGLDAAWARRTAEGVAWAGIAGARVGYVALNWPAFAPAPWTALYLWQPGYLPVAGLLSGVVYVTYRLRAHRVRERLRYARSISVGYAAAATALALVLATMGRFTDPGTLKPGDPVSDFALVDLDGETTRFTDLQGKGVVLNFWATWCPPCRREMPLLDAIQSEFGTTDLVVVGVSVGESLDIVRPFVDSIGVSYAIWTDPESPVPGIDDSSEVYARFGGVGLPTTFFIGNDGVIRSSYVGELNRAILLERIPALAGR